MQVFFEFLDFGVVGGLGSGWAKLNVVQKRWICAVVCTTFNFCEALGIFAFLLVG